MGNFLWVMQIARLNFICNITVTNNIVTILLESINLITGSKLEHKMNIKF